MLMYHISEVSINEKCHRTKSFISVTLSYQYISFCKPSLRERELLFLWHFLLIDTSFNTLLLFFFWIYVKPWDLILTGQYYSWNMSQFQSTRFWNNLPITEAGNDGIIDMIRTMRSGQIESVRLWFHLLLLWKLWSPFMAREKHPRAVLSFKPPCSSLKPMPSCMQRPGMSIIPNTSELWNKKYIIF